MVIYYCQTVESKKSPQTRSTEVGFHLLSRSSFLREQSLIASLPLKNDGWKRIRSFLGPGHLQRAFAVKLRECNISIYRTSGGGPGCLDIYKNNLKLPSTYSFILLLQEIIHKNPCSSTGDRLISEPSTVWSFHTFRFRIFFPHLRVLPLLYEITKSFQQLLFCWRPGRFPPIWGDLDLQLFNPPEIWRFCWRHEAMKYGLVYDGNP